MENNVMQSNAKAVHHLLNIVLCEDQGHSIRCAMQYLIDEGYLNEEGEPTAKAWTLQSDAVTCGSNSVANASAGDMERSQPLSEDVNVAGDDTPLDDKERAVVAKNLGYLLKSNDYSVHALSRRVRMPPFEIYALMLGWKMKHERNRLELLVTFFNISLEDMLRVNLSAK